MHAVIIAAVLNLWTVSCPVATLLPQNQYGGDCPSKCNCGWSCEAQKQAYCLPSCNGLTGAAYNNCTSQCAVTLNNCMSWCENNCPGDFGACS